MQINLVTPTPQSFSANLQKRQDLEIQAAARVVATHLTTYWDGKQSVHIESLSTDLNVRKGAIDLAIKAGWAAQYVGDGAYDLAEFPDRLPYKLDANIMVNSTPPIGCIIPTPLFLRSSLETKYINDIIQEHASMVVELNKYEGIPIFWTPNPAQHPFVITYVRNAIAEAGWHTESCGFVQGDRITIFDPSRTVPKDAE